MAGPTADGWRVAEVWESQEVADSFFEKTLGAALQRANISARPDVIPAYNIMQA